MMWKRYRIIIDDKDCSDNNYNENGCYEHYDGDSGHHPA